MSALDLIAQLTKHYGKAVIRSAAEMEPVHRIRCLKIPILDQLTGGGYPIGRVIEHVGQFSSTKSLVGYLMLAEFQHYDWANHCQGAFYGFEMKDVKIRVKAKKVKDADDDAPIIKGEDTTVTMREIVKAKTVPGYKPVNEPVAKRAALIDLEGTYTKEWGAKLGINNDALLYIQPETLNQAVDIVIALLGDPDISLVMFDSMGAVGPDAESEASMEKEQMGVAARFWNKAMRNVQAAINRNPAKSGTLIMINAMYEKIGFVLGDPEVIKHGNQMKLTKTISLRFRALKEMSVKLETGDTVGGRNISVKCLKNKTGVPLRNSQYYYSYVNDGMNEAHSPDTLSQWVELGMMYGLIVRTGANYSFGKLKVAGRDNFAVQLRATGELKSLIPLVYAAIEADNE